MATVQTISEDLSAPATPYSGSSPSGRKADGRIGNRLRAAREVRGLSTADIAEALNFTTAQVEALEAGAPTHMAPVYETGFVRSYACYLGEVAIGGSVDEAVAAFRAERGTPGRQEAGTGKAVPPQPGRSVRQLPLPGFSVISGTLVVAVVAYVSWQLLKAPDANAMPPAPGSAYHAAVMDMSRLHDAD